MSATTVAPQLIPMASSGFPYDLRILKEKVGLGIYGLGWKWVILVCVQPDENEFLLRSGPERQLWEDILTLGRDLVGIPDDPHCAKREVLQYIYIWIYIQVVENGLASWSEAWKTALVPQKNSINIKTEWLNQLRLASLGQWPLHCQHNGWNSGVVKMVKWRLCMGLAWTLTHQGWSSHCSCCQMFNHPATEV